MPGDPAKTDEHGRPKVTAGREKAISMDHNKRTGPVGRSGVNDFIAKCVTGRINDSQQLFHRLAFYARTVPVGKERASSFRRTRKRTVSRDRYNVTNS